MTIHRFTDGKELWLLAGALVALTCDTGFAQEGGVPPGERISFSDSDKSALPTSKVNIGTPQFSSYEILSDQFNEFVPGLKTRGWMELDPSISPPFIHVPYLQRGESAEDPDVVIARILMLDLTVYSSLIYTDNVKRDNSDKKSDIIVQGSLGIDATLQLTRDFQLHSGGRLAYYRAMDEESVSGYGFRDSFSSSDDYSFDDGFSLNGDTLFITSFNWDKQLGNWDFSVADRVSASDRLMANPVVNNEIKRTTELANIAWATMGRLLPTATRLGFLVLHANYWYPNDFNEWDRSENQGTVWLLTERYSTRLKPFANYSLRNVSYSHHDDSGAIINEGNAGIFGEVTDQLNAEASIGYGLVRADNSSDNTQRLLWSLYFDHLMNSRTREQLVLKRNLASSSQTAQSERTTFQYRIGRTLGPSLVLWLGFNKFINSPQGDETYDTKNWSTLINLNHDFAKNWNASLKYEYVNWDSDDVDYTENRVTLAVGWDIGLGGEQGIGMNLSPLDYEHQEPRKPKDYFPRNY